ncbi:ABC transporter substrate-binding protein [Neorhizobium sp. DT-125]|uniref:ABC transporter substrate-binding protein n=1 Tax=Neorhizobium sp. DT-125 TaxID=3396163 RepID=UPI003F1C105D
MKTTLKLTSIRMALTVSALVAGMSSAAYAKDVVRFLHNETDPPSIEFFNKAIADFEAQNPDIDVQMEVINTDGRLQKVLAGLNTKTMPEVFKILPEERFDFARNGYIQPLDDMINEIGADDFANGSLTKVDGKVYDMPYALGDYGVMWYRSDLLDAKGLQPPKTWDEMEAAAKAITGGSNKGFIIPAGKNRANSIFFAQMIWSAGGTFFDKDLNVTFNSPATVKTLEYLKKMAAYSPQGIGSYSHPDMINVYMTGTLGMDIYAGRLVANVAANRPDLLEKTKAASNPVGPSGANVRFVGANSFALSTPAVGAKVPAAAAKFLKYLVTGERLKNFSLTAFPHLIPPLKSVQDGVIKAGIPQIKGREDLARAAFETANGLDFESEAGAIIKDGKVTKSGVTNPYMGAIIARSIPAVVLQKVLLQGEDPREAAKWGQEEMQAVVDELKKH